MQNKLTMIIRVEYLPFLLITLLKNLLELKALKYGLFLLFDFKSNMTVKIYLHEVI